MGIGLALAATTLTVGAIDFDDANPFGLEVPREPGPIGPGPFDADKLDGTEIAQPTQQLLVAVTRRGEALDAQECSSFV